MKPETLSVTGMSCDGCERNVENALDAIDGASRAEVDHEGNAVEIVAEDDVVDDDLRAAIERTGYDVGD